MPAKQNCYRSDDWDSYRMEYGQPHLELEDEASEVSAVGEALDVLMKAGVIAHTAYDNERMLAHRQAVREHFDIPWTAISPRMQRLVYAINAVVQPANMIAAGVFCGNTFISNAGAAVGPGQCYKAERLVGIEINPEEAGRAEMNVRRIDPSGVAGVVAADAVEYVASFRHRIELLCLDADGTDGRGKGIYLDILRAGLDRMPVGSVVLAHNSVNCAGKLSEYLAFVRDPAQFRASVNVVLDPEGLEVSVK